MDEQLNGSRRWLSLECTCESCPLQIEGSFRGERFYYRARHREWRLYYPADGEPGESDRPWWGGFCDPKDQDSAAFALRKIVDLFEDIEAHDD